jgi:hypothetical protein
MNGSYALMPISSFFVQLTSRILVTLALCCYARSRKEENNNWFRYTGKEKKQQRFQKSEHRQGEKKKITV